MVLDGEDVEMGLGMVGEYLCLVDHKNLAWERQDSGRHRLRVSSWAGLVGWRQVIKLLTGIGYEGLICFHPEYDDAVHAAELVTKDREYVEGLIAEGRKPVANGT
jgi:hypothetical protein